MNIPRFWRGQPARYRLEGEQCRVCKKPILPPRDVCPHCTEEGGPAPLLPNIEWQGPNPEKRG